MRSPPRRLAATAASCELRAASRQPGGGWMANGSACETLSAQQDRAGGGAALAGRQVGLANWSKFPLLASSRLARLQAVRQVESSRVESH